MENKPIFKAHCSSIGKIMTNPREVSPMQKYIDAVGSIKDKNQKYADTKNKETKTAAKLLESIEALEKDLPVLESKKNNVHLSQTCISHLEEWMKEQLYDRRVGFRSKYTSKGNDCESSSIDFAAEYYNWGFVQKNEETKENDFIIGTCDVKLSNLIVDIKNSWSQKTFPLFDTKTPDDGYGWQGLGYLALWGKDRFQLTYTLMDAPEYLIEREARQRAWELGMEDVEADLYDEVLEEMTYSNLNDELRIKSFFFDRDSSKIESIYDRVGECREYIENSGFYELYNKLYLTK